MIRGLWIINTKSNLKRAAELLEEMAGFRVPTATQVRNARAVARDLRILAEAKVEK